MKTVVVENNKIFIKDANIPVLKDKGAIIKVFGCGLCGSDIVKYRQNSFNKKLILGHEIVGEIIKINSDTSFSCGERIAMGHHVPCFDCVYCKNKNYSMCRHFKNTNIYPAGFSEYIFITEEHLKNTVFKIPETMDNITASFLEPLACCIRAIKRANLTPSSKVLVIGLGSIGLLMGQALLAESQQVIGCDILPERVSLAKNLHFTKTIISTNENLSISAIKNFSNGYGVDAVFMTSGAYKTIPFALKAVRDGGKIVIFSSVKSMNGFANNEIYYRELDIIGSYSPAPVDLAKSLELLKTNKVIVQDFSQVYSLENLEQAIDDTEKNKILKAYINI